MEILPINTSWALLQGKEEKAGVKQLQKGMEKVEKKKEILQLCLVKPWNAENKLMTQNCMEERKAKQDSQKTQKK